MSSNNKSGGGIGFFSLLTILFIGLKLSEIIDWSWWLVLLPSYFAVALLFGGVVLIFLWHVPSLISAAYHDFVKPHFNSKDK